MAARRCEISLLVLKKNFNRSLRSLLHHFSPLEEKFSYFRAPCNASDTDISCKTYTTFFTARSKIFIFPSGHVMPPTLTSRARRTRGNVEKPDEQNFLKSPRDPGIFLGQPWNILIIIRTLYILPPSSLHLSSTNIYTDCVRPEEGSLYKPFCVVYNDIILTFSPPRVTYRLYSV